MVRADQVGRVDDRLDAAQAVVALAREERRRLPVGLGEVHVRVVGLPGLQRLPEVAPRRASTASPTPASGSMPTANMGYGASNEASAPCWDGAGRSRRRGGGSRRAEERRARPVRSTNASISSSSSSSSITPSPAPGTGCSGSMCRWLSASIGIVGDRVHHRARARAAARAAGRPRPGSPSQIASTTTNDLPRSGSGISGIGGNCRIRPTEVSSSGSVVGPVAPGLQHLAARARSGTRGRRRRPRRSGTGRTRSR